MNETYRYRTPISTIENASPASASAERSAEASALSQVRDSARSVHPRELAGRMITTHPNGVVYASIYEEVRDRYKNAVDAQRSSPARYPAPSQLKTTTLPMTTYQTLRAAVAARMVEWDSQASTELSLSYCGNEMAGEIGDALERALEVIALAAAAGRANNVIKKLDREKLGMAGSRATVQQLADELADAMICIPRLEVKLGIDLDPVVAFNDKLEELRPKARVADATGRPEGACYCNLSDENCRAAGHYRPLSRADTIAIAARALVDDVRRRHPGEEPHCPYMRDLDEALRST